MCDSPEGCLAFIVLGRKRLGILVREEEPFVLGQEPMAFFPAARDVPFNQLSCRIEEKRILRHPGFSCSCSCASLGGLRQLETQVARTFAQQLIQRGFTSEDSEIC